MTYSEAGCPGTPGLKSVWRVLGLAGILWISGGCAYYHQAVEGQWELVAKKRPNSAFIDNGADSELSRSLQMIEQLRVFASGEMGLLPGKAYTQYVDLSRKHVLWSLFAAPEFSLDPKRWWYPVVGSLSYRGYFDEEMARREAKRLQAKGFDVYVAGVDAYSTLGWFSDPVLNTFVNYEETELAELIFHELTHRKIYLSGETEFNEALATVIAQEGVRRWLKNRGNTSLLREYEQILEGRQAVYCRVQRARADLEALFEIPVQSDGLGRLRKEKNLITDKLRTDLVRISGGAKTKEGLRWTEEELNNATLNAFATYYDLLPLLEALLRDAEGDFEEFFETVIKRWRELQ